MFTSLSEMRKKGNDLTNLVKQVEELTKKTFEKKDEESFWQPAVDKAGNGFAIVRFLPAPKGEDLPFVRRWDHGFQGPTGKWYIENSLTTLGLPDPVSEANTILWNSSTDEDSPERKLARDRKRRLAYFSNILVVKDPTRPENEGKVFLYKYGVKIFAKIKNAMQPQFEGIDKYNPFDFWEGADLKVVIGKERGYRNYDESSFSPRSAISSDDDKINAIWDQCKSLKEFVDPKNFKSYEELKKNFDRVVGGGIPSTAMASEKAPTAVSEKPKSASKTTASKRVEEDVEESAEDSAAYFMNMANDD